jgi:hypothetical protein
LSRQLEQAHEAPRPKRHQLRRCSCSAIRLPTQPKDICS